MTANPTNQKIILLGGESGAGKTHRRTNDPALRNLPVIDMADLWREFGKGATYEIVVTAALDRAWNLLVDNNEPQIVVEAYFRPGSDQLHRFEHFAKSLNIACEKIYIVGRYQECAARIKADLLKDRDQERFNARMKLLNIGLQKGYIKP